MSEAKEPGRKRLSLAEWVQLGEVVGVFAVLASLLLVIYSINQNTTALRGATGNLVFELHSELQGKFIDDPALAALYVKAEESAAVLSEEETVRWTKYRHAMLDLWAMAYQRNVEGLYADAEWQAWNDYFVHVFSDQAERMTQGEWVAWSYGWDDTFWRWVGSELSLASAN